MFNRLTTDTLNKVLIIGAILLVAELSFSNGDLVFTVIFSSLFIYFGWNRYQKIWAKVVFWIGFILLIITIFNMTAFRFLLIAAIIYFFYHYVRSQKSPERVVPYFAKEPIDQQREPLIKIEPLLQQRFFGDQKTYEGAYEWRDINIHGGFGSRIIDLSNTVLPTESIISIRHFVGNITIYVPYEVEVHLLHSSMMGRADLFGMHHEKLLNQSISYITEGYHSNSPRVKIITSIWSGDIEVKRR
ncbi:lia operon protein LiaF [Bacillus mesophilus]|uniref:Cell wall-active antibiotics response protein n=1 Tax=Bacillus mesophilus TaxID=1808955 RepID=A0A6M0QBB8_9BACI|nr:cell wall-active antibiotics response protein LiaF [Bacillus mesophilus]MBM7662985.1 lia operon protein LiaF [Bacillus mesophilus]NEY73691.1 cell wall-active antibiotics response protein [Bacillus mesophilus]